MSLIDIKGIGPKILNSLNKNGIYTIDDLILSFPKTYHCYEEDMNKLFSGEFIYFKAQITSIPTYISYNRSNAFVFYVNAYGYSLKAIIFASEYLRYKLHKGSYVYLYGRYIKKYNEISIKKIFYDNLVCKAEVDYKLKDIPNSSMSNYVSKALLEYDYQNSSLPKELEQKYRLYDYQRYIKASHFPMDSADVRQVLRRRKYEEFFWFFIQLELVKALRINNKKPKRAINNEIKGKFLTSLSFELTKDQIMVMKEIESDILGDTLMNRLVQGDVGCGKTIVAIYAIMLMISAGYQAALMLPTEILAQQQYEACKKILSRLGFTVELLTSNTKRTDRSDILRRLIENRVSLLVGTHAIIEDNVLFSRLGLVVIDEEHKFGVKQRQALTKKLPNIDCLYLTATPIPRTLGLTSFGDLDISSIRVMPKNRLKIITKQIGYNKIKSLFKSIANQISLGRQCYVIVPLVSESDSIRAIDIDECLKMFKLGLPDYKIEAIHGKMSNDDKAKAMKRFKANQTNILISTTVIEVGVDVANATVMVIMDAHRFGSAQIHQLRGRVGRGEYQSYCILVSDEFDNPRLISIAKHSSGFDVAEDDLKERGPGDLLGSLQSGYPSFEYASLEADMNIWNAAKADATSFINLFLTKKIQNKIFDDIISENKAAKK